MKLRTLDLKPRRPATAGVTFHGSNGDLEIAIARDGDSLPAALLLLTPYEARRLASRLLDAADAISDA